MAAVEERIRLDDCYRNISQVFRIKEFNSHQKKAIDAIILEKKDVFVNLPTGSGKSLVFQAMPLMFDLVNTLGISGRGGYKQYKFVLIKKYGLVNSGTLFTTRTKKLNSS
ncbi:hypothetical protein QZH41_013092 [Actinostola sp. cb2023]|nr:hypothetical protein QZH41_013092 [Actinostola sp. cb2023]